jgi:hypothetical protein
MHPVVNLRWVPRLNPPVNKRDLSTGETGEFASEDVGFGRNPGVAFATPQDLSSNWRELATRQILRSVADTGTGTGGCCCQLNTRYGLGQKRSGSPKTRCCKLFSQRFLMFLGARHGFEPHLSDPEEVVSNYPSAA